jgi:hypothetical protein
VILLMQDSPLGSLDLWPRAAKEQRVKDLSDKHKFIQETIADIDDLAFWFLNNPHYMTDEIGVMLEVSLSRLQALESAVVIKMRQIAENKLADAMQNRAKSKERIDATRKEIEDRITKPTRAAAKAKPRPRAATGGSGRGKAVKARR